MKISKYVFFIFLVAFFSSFSLIRDVGIAVDKLIGVINHKPIFASEFEVITSKYNKILINNLYNKFYFFSNNAKGSLIIRLMEEKLFNDESNRFAITVPNEEIYPFFCDIIIDGKIKIRSKNVLEYLIKYARKQILKKKLFNHCVYSNIIITDEEISKKYYNESKLHQQNKKYDLCIIKKKFNNKNFGYKKSGYNFIITMKLANFLEKSKSSYSLKNLYFLCNESGKIFDVNYLGSFTIKELSNAFELEVNGLQKGMCSSIVKGEDVLSFFYILDIVQSSKIDLNEIKNNIGKNLILYKSCRELTQWLDLIKLSSSIEIIG